MANFVIEASEKEDFEKWKAEHDAKLIKAKEEIIKQYKWERDVAISQLETIGASFGLDMNLWKAEHNNVLLDKVAEKIKIRLIDNLGLEDATKYGNKNAKQQANSYATVMKYEIADCVDDLLDDLAKMKAEVTE